MTDYASIESCTDLTTEHAKRAASSSADIRAFLTHVASIARPDEGCPKVLMAVARLVGQDWVEGDLRVELTGDDEHTTLTVLCDFGPGIRERLIPATRFEGVPLDEFSRALHLAPALALPLRVSEEAGKIVLAPLLTPEERMKSVAPPAVELEEASLGEHERKTAPPPDRPTPPHGMLAATLGLADETTRDSVLPDTVDARPMELEEVHDELEEVKDELEEVKDELEEVHEDGPNDVSALDASWDVGPEVQPPTAPPPAHATPLPQAIPTPVPPTPVPPTPVPPRTSQEIATAQLRPSGIRGTDGAEGAEGDGDAPRPLESEAPKTPTIHTRPTVRRMVAVDVAAVRRHDPRREEDD